MASQWGLLFIAQGCFAARGAACASALCRVRCCFYERGVMLRTVLLVLQPFAARGAADVREELLRAVLRMPQPVDASGARAVCGIFWYARGAACASARCRVRGCCCARGILLRDDGL